MVGRGNTEDSAVTPALAESDVAVAILEPPDLTITYANPAHLALFGWQVGSALRDDRSAPPEPAHSQVLTKTVLDAAMTVLSTGEPLRSGEVPANKQYVQIVCSPIRASSVVSGVSIVTVDVTEQVNARKRAEDQHQRLSVLDEATAAMTTEVDPRRELAALAESVVPTLADACAVYLVDHPPSSVRSDSLRATRLICVIDPDTGIAPPAAEARLRLAPTRPMARVIRTGRAVRAIGGSADPRGWGEHWLTQLNPHSHVALPIGTPERVFAVISFAAVGDRPQYQESDIALMHQLTERVAVMVGRALRLQHTSEVALTLQRGLLSEPPEVPGLEIQVRYRPAGPGIEIGGDWYDAFPLPAGGLALTVGDVVGHDLYAANTMGQLRSMVQALACQPGAEPAAILTALNRLSTHLRVGEFASTVHGHLAPATDLAPATFTWANAGHPPPLLLGPGVPQPILHPAISPLLGLADATYQQHRTTLPAGAVLLLYTDGLMEDPERPSADAISELAATARDHAEAGLDELCDRLVAGAPTRDDIALLATRVLP